MTWDARQLADDVEAVYGLAQRELLVPCLVSVRERRWFAIYHRQEALRILALAATDKSKAEILEWMLDISGSGEHSHQWVRLQAAAHISACVHSLHSVVDILAHVVYFGTGMNSSAGTTISPRDLCASTLAKKVSPPTLKRKITDLIEDAGYTYLTALSNYSKHRSIVPMPFRLDLSGEDEQPYGLKFGSFVYKGLAFEERWVESTITKEYERQETLIHAIGHELNELITAKRR